MSVENINEKPIVNIVRTELETIEATPKIFRFDTASEATYAAVNSEGAENVLRVKNKILAIDRKEDIQYGSDITLNQVTFSPEVLALVDGGILVTDVGEEVTGYTAPAVGQPVNRKRFKLRLYTEEKDVDGETIQYACFEYDGCKGKPASFNFKDGEFMTPQYNISSRVKSGTAPYKITFIDTLPV